MLSVWFLLLTYTCSTQIPECCRSEENVGLSNYAESKIPPPEKYRNQHAKECATLEECSKPESGMIHLEGSSLRESSKF